MFLIFSFSCIFRFTAFGVTTVLTPHAAPSNLSHPHLLLERCHRFFFFLANIISENLHFICCFFGPAINKKTYALCRTYQDTYRAGVDRLTPN